MIEGGVNFSVFSGEATGCTLVLYHHSQPEPFAEIPFLEEFRIGHVYTMLVFGLNPETVQYGYRFDGPWRPEEGLRFDRSQVLLDPYAKSISGRTVWRKRTSQNTGFIHRGQIIREDYDWQEDIPPRIPANDLVIYETHVRSFTRHPSSKVRYGGTFAGLSEKIPYLKELGVNRVELMPIFEFDEFANTQFGNNNAYCQDSEISWLDWSRLEKNREVFAFVKRLIAIRKAHPVLRSRSFDFGHNGTGYPELSFHGLIPWQHDGNAHTLVFACLYAEDHRKYNTQQDAFLYLAINAHWEDHVFRLPIIPEGFRWQIEITSSPSGSFLNMEELFVPARSVILLIAEP